MTKSRKRALAAPKPWYGRQQRRLMRMLCECLDLMCVREGIASPGEIEAKHARFALPRKQRPKLRRRRRLRDTNAD